MASRTSSSLRLLRRAIPVVVAATLVGTGALSPAASAGDPILEARAQTLSDRAMAGFERQVETGLPTELVGFEWQGETEGAVEVRARQGRQWGPWMLAEGDPDEGPDRDSPEFRGRTTAGPVWVGHKVSQVQVRVKQGPLEGLKLHAIRSEDAPDPRGTIKGAGAIVSMPGIVSRAGWGADESFRSFAPGCTGNPEYAGVVRNAIVHHTDTSNTYGPADSAAAIRGIYYFHTHTKGWCDIGYNLLVDRFGQAFEGRAGGIDRAVVGAHALGFNRESTGVAVMGSFSTSTVPDAAISGLQRLLNWKLALHGIDPRAQLTVGDRTIPTIAGHRDVGSTECPGGSLHAKLGAIRDQAAVAVRPDRVQSMNSGKQLDVAGASTADGARTLQWPLNGGANQRWRVVGVPGGAFMIVSVHSGKVLDVEGGSLADGARIIQWPWNGGANQRWRLEPAADGAVRVTSVASGKVMDVAGASLSDGAPIIQWPSNGGLNQQWKLIPAS
ncbi:MAG: RICIN domain-containing protein [Acidimicrobiales bacterium]